MSMRIRSGLHESEENSTSLREIQLPPTANAPARQDGLARKLGRCDPAVVPQPRDYGAASSERWTVIGC
jgi:hypothetical protein